MDRHVRAIVSHRLPNAEELKAGCGDWLECCQAYIHKDECLTTQPLEPCPKCLDSKALTKWKDAEVSCGRCGFNAPFDVWQSRACISPASAALVVDAETEFDAWWDEYQRPWLPDGISGYSHARAAWIAAHEAAAPQQSDDAPASSPDYEKGFEAGCAFTVATLEDNLWHLNYVFDGRECCRRCALVKPAEGWARPCKGPHELSLRAVVPNTAASVEQSDAAKLAAAEIAQLEKPNHTAEAVAMQDCDICNAYRQKIAAIIERHFEGAR